MGGTSKRQKPEARGNVNIFSDPVVWSEQAEELYLKSIPRPEQAPPVGGDGVVGDTKHSGSSSVFSYNNSMSSFSDISNSLKYATGYPDSYGEVFATENGNTGGDIYVTPKRTNTNQQEEEARKEAILTLTPKTLNSEGKEIDDWDGDGRCCGLFRRAFEEEMVFRRLVHSAVCLLIIFAMLAVFIIIRSRLYEVESEDLASELGSAPSPYAQQPTWVRPAPTNPIPEAEPTSLPSSTPSSQPTMPTSTEPTFSPTLNITEEIKAAILSASPDSFELLENSTTAQFKALDWMSSPQSTDAFFTEEKLVQRWALAVLFFSTGGENWSNSDKWLTNFDECEWYTADDEHPVCDAEGRLYSLHLRDNNLQGTIPTELTLLSNSLAFLFLNDGTLRGTIPTVYGKLTNLQRFYLQINELDGTLPTELGYLTALENLALGSNDFTGRIPSELQQLEELRLLDLSGNELRGTIPTVVGRMRRLSSIILNRNKLTGTIPSYIGRLDRLRNLLLHSNRFEGDMPEEICELHQEDELDWITIDCDRMDCDSDCDCECA